MKLDFPFSYDDKYKVTVPPISVLERFDVHLTVTSEVYLVPIFRSVFHLLVNVRQVN